MKNQDLTVYLADDIDMNLGKAIAQVAHATGAAWLARMEPSQQENNQITLTLTPSARASLEQNLALAPNIVPVSQQALPKEDEQHIEIIDAGKTIFECPTKTCVAVSTVLGDALPASQRLLFNDDVIDYKQAFFVNRKLIATLALSDQQIMSLFAKASLAIILEPVIDGRLNLNISEPLYQWITSAFGKTVVGTRKVSKLLEVSALLDEDHIHYHRVYFNDHCLGYCTQPIDAKVIHKYTKYKTFNLLS